jgi:hypothetical protein
MRYDKLQPAILNFLSKQDWKAIASENASDEYKQRRLHWKQFFAT